MESLLRPYNLETLDLKTDSM